MQVDDRIYRSLLPILIINVAFMTAFLYYAVTFKKRPKTQEVLSRLHTSFLGVYFREFWTWLISPIVKSLAFLHFTPNMVTTLSIFMSLFTGYMIVIGRLDWAGWLIVLSGTMDMLDGQLARLTGQTTRSGAFYDACMDRYNDAFVYAGIGLYFVCRNFKLGDASFTVDSLDFMMLIVSILLILGTEVTSYSKARGEAMGFDTKKGLMQRPERVAFLSFFTVLYPFFRILAEDNGLHPDISLIISVIVMTVLVHFTAIARIVDLFRQIKITDVAAKNK